MPVVEEFISRDKAEEKYKLSRLPNEDGNTIRTINIGDYDAYPWSGLRVSHTKEIRRFIILLTNFKDGVLRIRFKLFDDSWTSHFKLIKTIATTPVNSAHFPISFILSFKKRYANIAVNIMTPTFTTG